MPPGESPGVDPKPAGMITGRPRPFDPFLAYRSERRRLAGCSKVYGLEGLGIGSGAAGCGGVLRSVTPEGAPGDPLINCLTE